MLSAMALKSFRRQANVFKTKKIQQWFPEADGIGMRT